MRLCCVLITDSYITAMGPWQNSNSNNEDEDDDDDSKNKNNTDNDNNINSTSKKISRHNNNDIAYQRPVVVAIPLPGLTTAADICIPRSMTGSPFL